MLICSNLRINLVNYNYVDIMVFLDSFHHLLSFPALKSRFRKVPYPSIFLLQGTNDPLQLVPVGK